MNVKQLDELKLEKRWCLWHLKKETDSKGAVSYKKVPDQVTERGERYKGASSTDPSTWATFAEVQAALDRNGDRFGGVGIFFDGDGLVGIDIDGEHDAEKDSRNPKETEVRELIGDTYTEISPSGNGLHLLVWADMETLPCKVYESTTNKGQSYAAWDKEQYKQKLEWTEDGVKYGLECYPGGRYFTFTGNVLDGLSAIENRTEGVRKFLDRYMLKSTRQGSKQGKPSKATTPTVFNSAEGATAGGSGATIEHSGGKTVVSFDPLAERPPSPQDIWKEKKYIERRLKKAMNSKSDEHNNKFSALYVTGNWQRYFPSQNEADESLCRMLAAYMDRNPEMIDKAFRQSALYREKWEREDYRTDTLNKALAAAINEGDWLYDGKDDVETKYKPDNYKDSGHAHQFAKLYHKELRWCPALGWIWWDGHVWRIGDWYAGRVAQRYQAKVLEEALWYYNETQSYNEFGQPVPDKDAEDFLKDASGYMQSSAAVDRTLKRAAEQLYIDADELNKDPYLLNTPGGVVDLKSYKMRQARPEDGCTKITAVAPGDEGAEMWSDLVKLVTSGDAELATYLQKIAGMCLIGKVLEQQLTIAYDVRGHNGKSTFFNAQLKVLGTYGRTISPDIVTQDRNNKGATWAELRGVRMVVMGELEQNKLLSSSALKVLTSTDRVQGEVKFKQPQDFEPSHTAVLFTNHLPRAVQRDGGTWSRIALVPFGAIMPKGAAEGEIKNYASVLAEKAGPAILKWMIQGAKMFIDGGDSLEPIPEVVRRATEEYKGADDWCGHFIRDCTIKAHPEVKIKHSEVYAAYQQWATDGGENYLHTRMELQQELEQRGWQWRRPQNVLTWIGRDLNPEIFGSR